MKKKIGLIAFLVGICAFGFAACNEKESSASENSGVSSSTALESSTSIENSESSNVEKPEAHVHDGNVWLSDDMTHWQVCDCGENLYSANHVKGPSKFSDGETEWYECVVCDSKIEITTHTHAYGGAWIANGEKHWNECTLCGEKTELTSHVGGAEWLSDGQTHWKTCTVCETKIENNAHTPDGTYSVGETTHIRSCSICGESIENEHLAKAELSKDEEYHWSECDCGKVLEKTAHSIGSIDISDPTNGKTYCACGKELGTIKTLLSEISIDLNAANGVVGNQTAAIDLHEMTDLSVEVIRATLGETELVGTTSDNVYTFDISAFDPKITGEMSFVATVSLGGQELTVRAPAVVATKVIRTLDDLSAVAPKTAKDEIYGYFVLGNDIDGNGAQLANTIQIGQQAYGFRGTFDGRGHTIKNFNTGNYGIFGNIAFGAVVKNVILEVNKAYSNVLAYAARSATITNVTVKVASVLYTGWYELITEINNSKVENLTVIYDESVVFTSAHALCKTYASSTFANVVVKTVTDNAVTNSGVPDGVTAEFYE